jgi:hypothetical protein
MLTLVEGMFSVVLYRFILVDGIHDPIMWK